MTTIPRRSATICTLTPRRRPMPSAPMTRSWRTLTHKGLCRHEYEPTRRACASSPCHSLVLGFVLAVFQSALATTRRRFAEAVLKFEGPPTTDWRGDHARRDVPSHAGRCVDLQAELQNAAALVTSPSSAEVMTCWKRSCLVTRSVKFSWMPWGLISFRGSPWQGPVCCPAKKF